VRTRIRTIKPEAFTDYDLWKAEADTGLPVIRCYAGLWCCADREGRFPWKPEELKTAICPYDALDFSRVLDALTTRGFLVHYASRGSEYGVVLTFTLHQVVNNREAPSTIPSHEDTTTSTCDPRVPDACARVGIPNQKGTEPEPEPIVPRTKRAATGKPVITWLTPYSLSWEARYQGVAPFGPMAKALRPLVDRHGEGPVLVAWDRYLAETDAAYASPVRFASTFGRWNGTAPPAGKQTQQERNLANIARGARELEEAERGKSSGG